jgi:hypothetical protein
MKAKYMQGLSIEDWFRLPEEVPPVNPLFGRHWFAPSLWWDNGQLGILGMGGRSELAKTPGWDQKWIQIIGLSSPKNPCERYFLHRRCQSPISSGERQNPVGNISDDMGLEGQDTIDWNQFVDLLFLNYIRIQEEEEDSLIWTKNPATRDYTSNWISYSYGGTSLAEKQWWWGPIWKLKAPLKSKIILWLAINNKLLTWDNGIKHGGVAQVFALCAWPMKKR